jgi:uncharacterized surface protein with fasciclin (FAS1) repeats
MEKKKIVSLLVIIMMLLLSVTALAQQVMPTLWINNARVESDVMPTIISGRFMVPIRVITENMGGRITWNEETRRAEVTTPAVEFGQRWTDRGMLMWQANDAANQVAQGNAMVLDVRGAALFEQDGVAGAINIPVAQLGMRLGELDRDMTYAVYCASDINAAYAVAILNMNNIDAYTIVGGREAYAEAWAAIDPDDIVQPSIVDIALGNDDFSILVAALVEADLVDALSGDGPFTVFAPTNAAFGDLLEALDIEAADLLAHPQLADVLLYHVVSGRVLSTDLVDGMQATTLQGEMLTVDLTDGVMINASQVTTADIMASNGVIHVIDTVLVPDDFSL